MFPTGDRPSLSFENGAYATVPPVDHAALEAATAAAVAEYAADAPKRAARAALQTSDARMARVAEDIIDLLKAKGLIADADLPVSVTALIAERKTARVQLGGGGQ
jgi:hypothetical protein